MTITNGTLCHEMHELLPRGLRRHASPSKARMRVPSGGERLREVGLARPAALPPHFELSADENLTFQTEHESAVRSYPRRIPIVIERADGVWIRDTRGQVFLDCLAGAGALPLGHNHSELNATILEHLQRGTPLQTLDLATPLKVEFMKELLAFLPPAFAGNARLQFCSPSGSDAIEAAMKLAKLHTGRSGIFAFRGGYHGMTTGALAATGNLAPKERRQGLMPDVTFLPYPYSLRCPFGVGGEEGARIGLRQIESLLTDVESGTQLPAAFLVEAVQGEGGVIPAPEFWLREIRRITSEHGILLITDEVQSGFARTGRRFAFEHAGIVPDIVVMSKAVGGGLPLAVLAFDAKLDAWRGGEHTGTFRGNQLAMATGLATMRIIRRDGLCDQATARGELLMQQLRALDADCIGEIRGRGLMVGVEIVDGQKRNRLGHPAHGGERAARIQTEALRRGLIIERGGRHGCVLRFLPPLIIDEDEIEFIVDTIGAAIQATA